jgi:formylglycine-generating enzyme required for sulfatase activity
MIPAKDSSFQMGRTGLAQPVHKVSFTYDFWMDTIEVTQKSYLNFMSAAYAWFGAPAWDDDYGIHSDYPAYYVNLYDAILYCNARSKKEKRDTVYSYTSISDTTGNQFTLKGLKINMKKKGYRLPSEAEWEYAYRAGSTTDYYWGKNFDPYPSTKADSVEFGKYSVWTGNSGSLGSDHPDYGVHVAGSKKPNKFGLYDMSGNLFEWTNDRYGNYSNKSQTDPIGPNSGTNRVVRSSGWSRGSVSCGAAFRLSCDPKNRDYDLGFRCVLPLVIEPGK